MTAAEIRALRKSLGLTQTQLAGRLGVEYHTIMRWGKGSHKPHPVFARMLKTLTQSIYNQADPPPQIVVE